MTQRTRTIPAAIIDRIVRGRAAMNMLLVIGASVLIALAAQVALPIPGSPVPLTLQPLAVIVVGVTLGRVRGAAAAMLYLLEGISGLPVFAQGHAGPGWLLGATAGYLYSYPFAAWVAGWFSERGWGNTTLRAVAGMLAALMVIYAGGWSWLAILSGPRTAFTWGIAPFFIADILKVALGATLLPQLQKLVNRG
ncbi:MAG: BioY protein [Acidobacteria bacterium]|jgi:biotin transport system substrate-specific component|nr:BioY protein [Acidobacteriota bacterium]